MANVKALVLSHTVIFAAGFAAGKLINQDELETYRALHESSFTKFKRRASAIGLGILAMGTLIVFIRATRK